VPADDERVEGRDRVIHTDPQVESMSVLPQVNEAAPAEADPEAWIAGRSALWTL